MNAQPQSRDLAPAVSRDDAAVALSRVILDGDLSRLSDADRVTHYNATCQSLGLNPLTRPLEYIKLNGKLVLYARKDCTDQLRALRRVSVTIADRTISGDLVMVTARATTPDGRQDEDIGSVPLGNLQGEAKANAIMKAMTKAKRRVTLSICGLGFLDETEVESITPSVVGLAVPDAPALPAPVHPMNNPNTMQSQGLALLDDALAAFGHMDDIKGYLAEPKVQRARQRAIEAGKGDAFAEIVQRHFDRVNPPEPGAIEPEETEQ